MAVKVYIMLLCVCIVLYCILYIMCPMDDFCHHILAFVWELIFFLNALWAAA